MYRGLMFQRRWCWQAGEFVKVRDGQEPWVVGRVKNITNGEPLILRRGWKSPTVFGEVEKIDMKEAPGWVKEGSRVEHSGERTTVDSVEDGMVFGTADGWRKPSTLLTSQLTPLDETAAQQILYLLKHPSRCFHIIRTEGPAVFYLYLLLRLPLSLIGFYLSLAATGSFYSSIPQAELAALVSIVIALGHLTRPVCLYLAMYFGRKLRWTARLSGYLFKKKA
eukprot:TRINITY_DN24924_c0_g1_i1.p1 TRINITY_DN24924_c0_g1~~TRINITY_DN24924_c0_g1_i1.p1  ORF type:complete len:239 (+),score=29.57 TRINITY_DN24924_c0_g1_i1:54-719(+)